MEINSIITDKNKIHDILKYMPYLWVIKMKCKTNDKAVNVFFEGYSPSTEELTYTVIDSYYPQQQIINIMNIEYIDDINRDFRELYETDDEFKVNVNINRDILNNLSPNSIIEITYTTGFDSIDTIKVIFKQYDSFAHGCYYIQDNRTGFIRDCWIKSIKIIDTPESNNNNLIENKNYINMENKNIIENFEIAASNIVKLFMKRIFNTNIDDYNLDDVKNLFVSNDITGILEYNDYFINFSDIYLVINNNVSELEFKEWYDYNLKWSYIDNNHYINLQSWIKKCPRRSEAEYLNAKMKLDKINDLKLEFENYLKELKL
jgi:hypothetical protein